MGLFERIFGRRAPRAMPVHIDDDNFEEEVLRARLPVMLDVWGPDCAPCLQLEPIVMRLAGRYQGRVKVAEVNAAAAPRTMRLLHVRGTPTVIYFRGRSEVERVVGFRSEPYHEEIILSELLPDERAP